MIREGRSPFLDSPLAPLPLPNSLPTAMHPDQPVGADLDPFRASLPMGPQVAPWRPTPPLSGSLPMQEHPDQPV